MDGAFPSQPGGGYPGGGRGGDMPRRGFRGTAENAKTKLCTRWMAGECRFGERCNFAHGEHELRTLPPRDDFGAGRGRGGYGPPRGGYGGGRGVPGGGYGGRGRGDEYGYNGGYGGGYGGGGGYPPQDQYGGYGGPREPMPQRMPEDPYRAQGFPVHGPNGWVAYKSPEGETYYHNFQSQITQWERPADWPHAPM